MRDTRIYHDTRISHNESSVHGNESCKKSHNNLCKSCAELVCYKRSVFALVSGANEM